MRESNPYFSTYDVLKGVTYASVVERAMEGTRSDPAMMYRSLVRRVLVEIKYHDPDVFERINQEYCERLDPVLKPVFERVGASPVRMSMTHVP